MLGQNTMKPLPPIVFGLSIISFMRGMARNDQKTASTELHSES